jgi:hypothetical protein
VIWFAVAIAVAGKARLRYADAPPREASLALVSMPLRRRVGLGSRERAGRDGNTQINPLWTAQGWEISDQSPSDLQGRVRRSLT